MVIPAPAAHLAQNIHVGQKIHLDAPLSLALARLAPSTRDVERKTSRLVPALARLRQHRIQIANRREHPGIRRWIRPRSPPNRRLVDADDLINILRPRNRLVLARLLS